MFDSDLAIVETCDAVVSETRLRCADGERRRLYDKRAAGPLYVLVRASPGATSLRGRAVPDCEEVGKPPHKVLRENTKDRNDRPATDIPLGERQLSESSHSNNPLSPSAPPPSPLE